MSRISSARPSGVLAGISPRVTSTQSQSIASDQNRVTILNATSASPLRPGIARISAVHAIFDENGNRVVDGFPGNQNGLFPRGVEYVFYDLSLPIDQNVFAGNLLYQGANLVVWAEIETGQITRPQFLCLHFYFSQARNYIGQIFMMGGDLDNTQPALSRLLKSPFSPQLLLRAPTFPSGPNAGLIEGEAWGTVLNNLESCDISFRFATPLVSG